MNSAKHINLDFDIFQLVLRAEIDKLKDIKAIKRSTSISIEEEVKESTDDNRNSLIGTDALIANLAKLKCTSVSLNEINVVICL